MDVWGMGMDGDECDDRQPRTKLPTAGIGRKRAAKGKAGPEC